MSLDAALYKDLKTSRGFNYHYYITAPKDVAKPSLLFLHGFPSTSRDWKLIIDFFQPQGYGIIAPDLLGYGGTSKPTDVDAFRMKHMVGDIMEILDAEKVERVVVISHDWGTALASRLANYHAERFIGFAFLSASYMPPMPDFDLDAVNAQSLQLFGYTCYGYWHFFSREDASDILQAHINSIISLGFAKDPVLWKDHLCAMGGLEKWLLEDRTTESILSDEEFKQYVDVGKKEGFKSPLNWYNAFVYKLTMKDDAEIPKEKYLITKPVFYGACSKDMACIASMGKAVVDQTCPNATYVEYDVGHWVIFLEHNKLSKDLQTWIDEKVLSTSDAKA